MVPAAAVANTVFYWDYDDRCKPSTLLQAVGVLRVLSVSKKQPLQHTKNAMENPGFDPGTSRMRSERSTN